MNRTRLLFIGFVALLLGAFVAFVVYKNLQTRSGANNEPGVDVVLFGTGSPEHLRTNIASILKPPLPEADRLQLTTLFGHLVGIGLDAPHLSRTRH